jgi:hypothetical protein
MSQVIRLLTSIVIFLSQQGTISVRINGQPKTDKTWRYIPNGDRYAMPAEASPADHVFDIFCGPRGEGQDSGELYQKSDVAAPNDWPIDRLAVPEYWRRPRDGIVTHDSVHFYNWLSVACKRDSPLVDLDIDPHVGSIHSDISSKVWL